MDVFNGFSLLQLKKQKLRKQINRLLSKGINKLRKEIKKLLNKGMSHNYFKLTIEKI